MKNLALIVAAGSGSRFGGPVPKQYTELNGKTVLGHSLEAFLSHPEIDGVAVVIAKNDEYWDEYFGDFSHPKLLKPIVGGAERQDSVRLGLEGLRALEADNVLVHDAARPYISPEVISDIIYALKTHPAAIPVIPARDSVRYEGKAIDRNKLKLVQTPQGFHYNVILEAHLKAAGQANRLSDDAQVAEANGISIHYIDGDEMNVKLTTKQDVRPQTASFRTGTGFDVHGFETGTHVNICGVKIVHTHGLSGHSDADVGLHALVDALLGAIGEGDIGEHFPPSDAKWRGADSAQFVEHAVALVKAKNAVISNADITIICEEPKLTPHKPAMKARVAELLGIAPDCVNIKATTTEKLGFTGRKEGIAAQAVATVAFFG